MAGKITDLSVIAAIDRANDLLEIVDVSANTSNSVTPNGLMGITGSAVGTTDVQSVQNKTLDNTNAITLKDTLFILQDDGDTTKQVKFQLSGITTATTRTLTIPDTSDTLVTLAATQTLINKTFTSPIINTATISNPTLTVDSIAGFSTGTIVSVANLSISNGVLNSNNSVKTSNYQNASVTADKLATGAATSVVAASEITASATYVALATAQSTTVTVGANGLLLVGVGAQISNSGANTSAASFALSGANTLAAGDQNSVANTGTAAFILGRSVLLTGLTPGSTTVTMLFKSTSGTATFVNRNIYAIPL